jgi:hypothetical protein
MYGEENMFGRLLTIAILVGAGYWYWSGPYQKQHSPGSSEKLQQSIDDMRECVRGMNYKLGATGVSEGDPEQVCADRYNLYLYEGQWHSTDELHQDR